MKSFVRITLAPEGAEPGWTMEYVVDDTDPHHGSAVAAELTAAIDTRPDVDGRLAELRRHLGKLKGIRPRSHAKPSGGRSPGARVQYNVISRTTGKSMVVQLRHYDKPTDVGPNIDEPSEG